MQFLLAAVNAKYIHTNPAIYSLRAYAGEEFRPFIALAEYTINHRADVILEDLYRRKPDVIGFSCYIWNWELICRLLPEIPKVLPKTEIWLGGPEVSFEAEQILRNYPMIRGIMVGEGEKTFKELMGYYVSREQQGICGDLSQIRGLVLKDGATGLREPMDINCLPFPYEEPYFENLEGFQNKIVYYESSRGCPFRCSYCLSSIDRQVCIRDLNAVKKELQFFLDRKIRQVKFVDRTFNCNREHALEIWKYLKEHDNGVTNFHFEVAADLMQEEELELLSGVRPGQIQLEIGVQTTNPKTLQEINRTTDIARIAGAVAWIRSKHNIHIHLDLIAGLPWEGYAGFRNSFNAVYAMRPEQLQLGFLKILKGTAIRDKAEEYGIVCQDRPPYEILYNKWISYAEIRKLKQIEEMTELYFNTSQFAHTLQVLEKEFRTPFELFEALAEFYEGKGYFEKSPARSRRYEVLLEFIEEKVCRKRSSGEKETARQIQLYRELLTYDYYLRENAKSRPAFANDPTEYRDRIWKFYQREEKEAKLLDDYRKFHARQTMKMTHVEVFHYPVWDTEQLPVCGEDPQLILFDYAKRDALTGNAVIAIIK